MVATTFLERVQIPAARGIMNLDTPIGGIVPKVDPAFRDFFAAAVEFESPGLNFNLYQAAVELNAVIEVSLEMEGQPLQPADGCAMIAHLRGDGLPLLDIMEGEEETNLILGYGYVRGTKHVFFVEHEKEEGDKEEYHYHARPFNRSWGDDRPLVLKKM